MTPHQKMIALFLALWPAISEIDWLDYTDGVTPYDDQGVPKYTGMIMHRSDGKCIGAHTLVVGFLPRPEKSAMIAAAKTGLLRTFPEIKASLERRDPERNLWAGGIRCSHESEVSYAISGLPEVADHLLMAQMMRTCGLLEKQDWQDMTDELSDHMTAARERFDMSPDHYSKLKRTIFNIVEHEYKYIAPR